MRDEVIDLCFHLTPSRLQGAGFEVLAQESLRRHTLGFPNDGSGNEGGCIILANSIGAPVENVTVGSPHVIADLQTAAGRIAERLINSFLRR
ncbi:MAG: hypothetical protein Ct9H300mP13_2400 [Gammaproteobacteria bacterium]|nr:MAG: hypothetical protein Ct9H300mP13_2400 [Gammaproteobacteria bacterium]